jgi:hypothetical protein
MVKKLKSYARRNLLKQLIYRIKGQIDNSKHDKNHASY